MSQVLGMDEEAGAKMTLGDTAGMAGSETLGLHASFETARSTGQASAVASLAKGATQGAGTTTQGRG